MSSSFGHSLDELTKGKPITYTDGCLEVRNVTTNDRIYHVFFSDRNDINVSYDVWIESLHKEYEATTNSPIHYYSIRESFDGFTPMVLFIPKQGTMVFMHSIALL